MDSEPALFIKLLDGTAAMWPLLAHAQQPAGRVYRFAGGDMDRLAADVVPARQAEISERLGPAVPVAIGPHPTLARSQLYG